MKLIYDRIKINMVHGLNLTCEMNWKEFETTYYTSRVVEKREWLKEMQEKSHVSLLIQERLINISSIQLKSLYTCAWVVPGPSVTFLYVNKSWKRVLNEWRKVVNEE